MYVPLLPVRFFSMPTTKSKLSQIPTCSCALNQNCESESQTGEPDTCNWKQVTVT